MDMSGVSIAQKIFEVMWGIIGEVMQKRIINSPPSGRG
jgi:hypothetical protein